MADDLQVRLSCPKCSGFRFKLGDGEDTICQGCGAVMRYWKGRYRLHEEGPMTDHEKLAFDAGYRKGREDGVKAGRAEADAE